MTVNTSEDIFKINIKKTRHEQIKKCLEIDFEKDLEKSLEIEWLETNGLGSYSSSTIVGANTRKYHGLLVAAMKPPVKRWVLLNKLEESIEINGEKTELSTNIYPGVIHPQGNKVLIEFSKNPFPTFIYSIGNTIVKKTIFLFHHENTVAVVYEVTNAPKNSVMEINPFLTIRGFHNLLSPVDFQKFNVFQYPVEKTVVVSSVVKASPKICFYSDATSFSEKNKWYYNLVYQKERDRGYKFTEDNFCPCKFNFQLNEVGKDINYNKPIRFFIIAKAMQPNETVNECKEISFDLKKIDFLMKQEKQRRINLVKTARKQCNIKNNSFFDSLVLASDQFVVKRDFTKNKSSIIAGYHWFSDWGRDAMISFNGLLLCTKRYEEAKQTLLMFSKYHKKGLLPNRFVDNTDDAQYNSVDVSLWFFVAVMQYIEKTKCKKFVKENLWSIMKQTIESYKKSVPEGFGMDSDGLIKTNSETQLTWMDAKPSHSKPITPRSGKPVEIQALWFNALMVASNLAKDFEQTDKISEKYLKLAKKVKKSFNKKFWNKKEECLFDVVEVDGGTSNSSKIRPNQLIATSLNFDLLDSKKLNKIVFKIKSELLSSKGLLTLSKKDPDFKNFYCGNVNLRDSTYHQGTIWPWLIGPYVKSLLKSDYCSKAVLFKTKVLLEGFVLELEKGGLGTISEIFEVKTLKEKGCIAQAWSIGQLLESYCLILEKK